MDDLNELESLRALDENDGGYTTLDVSPNSEFYRYLYGGEGPDSTPTFENFVVGKGNGLAYKTARIVAERPGETYSPLFLYGPKGCGKTHLLKAIANRTERVCPALAVCYVTADRLFDDFLHAARSDNWEVFNRSYRRAGVLLVDDVQLLEDRGRASEQLIAIGRSITDQGGQLVLACDHAPEDFSSGGRCTGLFTSGLVVCIDSPDRVTRRAILGQMASRLNTGVETWVTAGTFDWLADVLKPDGHVMAGVVKALIMGARASNQKQIGIEQARGFMWSWAYGVLSQRVDVETVQEVVEGYFGLERGKLATSKRNRRVAMARRLAVYLCFELTSEPFQQIGEKFGLGSPVAVYPHLEKARRLLEEDSEFRTRVVELAIRILRAQ